MRGLARRRIAPFACLLLLCGCDDPKPVPFGLVEEENSSIPPAKTATALWTPVENESGRGGLVFPIDVATPGVTIEGAHLPFDGQGCVLWTGDLDADGDRDGILLSDTEAGFELAYAIHQGGRFDAWETFASVDRTNEHQRERCCEGVRLQVLGEQFLHATVPPCAEGGNARTPHARPTTHWLATLDRRPRLQVELHVNAEGSEADLTFQAEDRNEDGHLDVIASRQLGEHPIELLWLNHSSGFVFQPTHVDTTIAQVLEPEWQKLEPNDPEERAAFRQALTRSREVLELVRAVCDGGSLSCQRSSGAGEAVALESTSLARLGATGQAVRGFESLGGPAYRTSFRQRRVLRAAIETNATRVTEVQEGPATAENAAPAQLSAVAFLNEDDILLRGASPKVWSFGTGSTRAAAEGEGSRRLTDPSGALAIQSLDAPCTGFTTLQIHRIAAGPALPDAARPIPVDGSPSRCRNAAVPGNGESRASGPRLNGWLLLGWAPQGILADRFGELRLVPVSATGAAVEAARTLVPGSPVPAPVAAGAMEPSGEHYVVPSQLGLLWRSREQAKTHLIIPVGWPAEGTSTAVSPSGTRFAYVSEGKLRAFELQQLR